MKLLIYPVLLLISFAGSGQEIIGKWYSQDSTRIYFIYKNDNQFEAILEKSSRENDREGAIILRNVTYVDKKRRYEGVIYSADRSAMPVLAKIRFGSMDGKVLRLRLKRMFFMDVTIKWYKVEENKMASL